MLDLQDLKTYFYLDEGTLKAVDGVSFKVGAKQTLGVIGESGCGKSITALSTLRIVPKPGKIVSGKILLRSRNSDDVLELTGMGPNSEEIRHVRGKEVSMIFQEPMTSLSPVHTIGNQIIETIRQHVTKDKAEAKDIALDMLNKVGIPNPSQRINYYPHQLSGGLRQRTMIAMALACNPTMLIADEPTTALDVTVQAQILDLMAHLQDQLGMSIMYITHDLGVVAGIATDVAVMYLGRVVEQADTRTLFKHPLHPYTGRLLKSIPKMGRKARTRLDAIKGNVPMPLDPPRQCGFFSRCPEAVAGLCDKDIPALVQAGDGHLVRCFLHSKETEPHDE